MPKSVNVFSNNEQKEINIVKSGAHSRQEIAYSSVAK
jgi:hypothetical protein